MFVLVYTNQDPNSKRFNARKDIIKDFNIIINRKNIYDQGIDSDMK